MRVPPLLLALLVVSRSAATAHRFRFTPSSGAATSAAGAGAPTTAPAQHDNGEAGAEADADADADADLLALYSDAFDADAVYRATGELDDGDGRGDPALPGWADPRRNHGSMLDLVGNGLREPINAIISGKSDPRVLTDAGLRDYIRTIGFSFECLDLHRGGRQRANLGDGAGWKEEAFEYRQTHLPGAPGRWIGSCWESLYGGNHFRVWKQNGSEANTGAWFLAISKEKNLRFHHTIDTDGYNIGRDLLATAAERGGRWQQYHWRASTEWVEGLMEPGRQGINHNISVDGRVVVLTVKRVVTDSLEPCDPSRPESAWTICEPAPPAPPSSPSPAPSPPEGGRRPWHLPVHWPWNRHKDDSHNNAATWAGLLCKDALTLAASLARQTLDAAPAVLQWAEERVERLGLGRSLSLGREVEV